MSQTPGNSSLIPVRPGERLADRYVVERVVGTGGMGVVVAARHEQLGRTVAIKILTASNELQPEAVERFLREARAVASLRSEHIARVMDAGKGADGRHFIVMEYLEGEDLGSIIRRGEQLSVAQAVGYLLQACEALAEAHGQGIIHRDLKPENIFLTRRIDGSPLIKVLDFGISKMTARDGDTESLSASGPRSLLGSPLYMSPEQIRTPANIGPRSDVWALGVILFELLTGRRPFNAPSLPEILATILKDEPPRVVVLRDDVPARLGDVVARCLEKEVDRRVASVGALAQALNEWAPRWARDASSRAARVAGIATQRTLLELKDLLPAAASDPAVGATEPRAKTRSGAAMVALLMAAVACGLLSAGALLIYRARNGSSQPPTTRIQAFGAAIPTAATTPAGGVPAAAPPNPSAITPPEPASVEAPAASANVAPRASSTHPAKRFRDKRPILKAVAAPVDPLEGRQ